MSIINRKSSKVRYSSKDLKKSRKKCKNGERNMKRYKNKIKYIWKSCN